MTAIVYATRQDLDDLGGLPDGMLSNPGREVESCLAGTDILTLAAHGLQTDNVATVRAAEGGTLSAPLVDGTNYYVIRVNDDSFKLSLTAAGAAIDMTTTGVSMVVTKSLPIDRLLEAASRWVEDCVPAHLVPFEVDADGAYPILIVQQVCKVTAAELMQRAGKGSELVKAAALESKAQLDRWSKGRPLRDAGITASASKAIISTLASTADPRGWAPSGSGTIP